VLLTLRLDLLRLEHEVVRAGHPGVNQMYASMPRHSYWESMAADVHDSVASFAFLAWNTIALMRCSEMLKLFLATGPFASLSMDLLGRLSKTRTGEDFLLIFVYRFSKLVRDVPLARITATDVTSAFFRDRISAWRPPDTVLTDNGPQFASMLCQGVRSLIGFRKLYTTTHHLQTNAQVYMTPHPGQSVALSKDTVLESLKAVISHVGESTAKTLSRNKRIHDKTFHLRRVSVESGDFVYLC